MIPLVNDLLGTVFAGVGVPLRFDTPSSAWTDGIPKDGFLDAFLYQVRDETNAQNVGWEDVYDDDGRVFGRRPPDRYFRFAYLVTAWGASIEAEHVLLGKAMRAVVEHEALGSAAPSNRSSAAADSAAAGSRSGSDSPLRFGNSWVTVGSTHLWSGVAAHEVFSSLGVAFRSSLDVVVVAPLRLDVKAEAGPPTESMTLGMMKVPATGTGAVLKKDPVADRQFSALRLREQANEPRPIKRQM